MNTWRRNGILKKEIVNAGIMQISLPIDMYHQFSVLKIILNGIFIKIEKHKRLVLLHCSR